MQLLTQTLSGISALADHQRRFPPPWSAEETDACYIVRNAKPAGARLYLFRGGAGTALSGAPPHTRDEARRIAANIAKLPVLLRS